MKTLAAICVVGLAACSQRVYSPPSQAFGVAPVTAMPAGARTLDVELAQHSAVFDPALYSGAARLSQGIGKRTEVTVEGTAFGLDAGGTSKANRNIYAGRAGIRTSPGEDLALFAGAGGGYAPAGGAFTTLDAGLSIGIDNCVVVPVLQGSAFVSQPLAARRIDVTTDPMYPTFDTPSRTVGATVRGGLRVALTPAVCRRGDAGSWLYAGLDVTGVMDNNSSDQLMGLGMGLSVPLD